MAACSDDTSSSSQSTETTQAPTTTWLPASVCVTTPAPDGRVVSVTIDDVVGGFGSFGLQADGGLTPGIVRVEVTGDINNASPMGVTILRDGSPVATVSGVAAGETCGIDLEVTAGVYHVTNGDSDVEFTVEP
ncbi:MAG: hypothetical protein K8R99_05460 [Actinomycetia bacterium]|nr:hypothetical protein [Actinomycetes bacterium]